MGLLTIKIRFKKNTHTQPRTKTTYYNHIHQKSDVLEPNTKLPSYPSSGAVLTT